MLRDESKSLLSYMLPRRLTHDVYLLRKIFISPPSSNQEVKNEKQEIKTHDLEEKLLNPVSGNLAPREQSRLNRQAAMVRFFDGVSAINQFWPLFFFPALGFYDLLNYFYTPQNRYGVQLSDLLLGFSRNYNFRYASLSLNMGGDIYTQGNFWPFSYFYGSALLFGVMNSLILWGNPKYYDSLIPESDRSLREKITNDLLLSCLVSRSLSIIRFKLIWKDHPAYRYQEQTVNNRINENRSEEEQYFNEIKQMTEKGSFFVKWQAMDVLADIIYYRDQPEDQMSTKSLEILKGQAEIKKLCKDPLSWLLVQFKLFGIGYSQYKIFLLFSYVVLIPLQLLSQWHYWALLFSKLTQIVQYQYAKKSCEQNNKIYRLVPEKGYFACTVCNHPYIDYRRSNSPQACLDDLLSFEQNSAKIIEGLQALSRHGPYVTIDFSYRAWFKLSIADWRKIWEILQSKPFNTALVLNLSQPVLMPIASEYYASVGQALKNMEVINIDFSNLILDNTNLDELLPGFISNSVLQNLNFSNCQLKDSGVSILMNAFSSMISLRNLILHDNQFSGMYFHI